MFEIKAARTLNEIYEQDFLPQRQTGIPNWRTEGSVEGYWDFEWRRRIEFYASHRWHMMVIAARGKRPIENRSNYSTKDRKWPRLRVDEAIKWVGRRKDFNLAVLGEDRIFWLDIDEPQKVPASFLGVAATQFLTMRTARGLAIPIEGTVKKGSTLIKRLSDIGVDTVRKGNSYQLVPLSITCTRDNGTPDHRVDFGNSPCINAPKHDLRVREWLDLSKPVMTQKTLRGLLK